MRSIAKHLGTYWEKNFQNIYIPNLQFICWTILIQANVWFFTAMGSNNNYVHALQRRKKFVFHGFLREIQWCSQSSQYHHSHKIIGFGKILPINQIMQVLYFLYIRGILKPCGPFFGLFWPPPPNMDQFIPITWTIFRDFQPPPPPLAVHMV